MITKKRHEKEIKQAVRKALNYAENQGRIYQLETKIHRLTARIGKLEAQLEEQQKGSIKGYYMKGEEVCTTNSTQDGCSNAQ